MANKQKKKVLVLGWDAAEWKVILPLIQEGKMPALKRLMDEGVHGRLKTLDPPLSPMLWTSIATGFRADKHGIMGFVEPTPDGQGLRPVTSTSRKVKAIWNILNQEGYKSNVVAWWPSNPAEPINGVMVSNLFQGANKPLTEEWKMPKGTIHPKSMTETMQALRVHPHELTASMLLPFLPKLVEDDKLKEDKRVGSVAKILAHAATVHAAHTYLMRETEWDFMAVYHDAIDHFSHVAMRYHPPRRDFIKEEDYENFKGVVEAGYRFHDMMLDRILDLIDDDTTILLLSDHGFHPDHLRPAAIPNEPSGPAIEHSPYGIFVMRGPGIRKGEEISGASVIDITPTLLTLYGLPVGRDMEGKVLTQVFEQPVETQFIDSWEKVPGDTGMHNEELREDPWAAQEALQQLVELGYIDAMDDNKLEQVEKSKLESKYYVARNHLNARRVKEGISMLEEIFEASKIIRYGKRLASAYLQNGAYNECEILITKLKERERELFENKKAEVLAKDPNDTFGNKEMDEPMYLEYTEGLLLLAKNRPRKALPILEKVLERNQSNLHVCLNIAQIFMNRKNYKEAERYFIKALAIDDQSISAHHGLGVCYLRTNRLNLAIDEFLATIDLNFYHARAHYHLGEALYKSGDPSQAVDPFKVAVQLAPGMSKAHRWLIKIYREDLKNSALAEEHEQFLKESLLGEVIIVTGLPGSGADMLLKELETRGLPVSHTIKPLTDSVTKNEPVTYNLDQNWLDDALGKVVFIPLELLNYLPKKYAYRFILVERTLEEALDEHHQKLPGKRKNALPLNLITTFQNKSDLMSDWLDSQEDMNVFMVHYDDLTEDIDHVIETVIDYSNLNK